MIPSFPSFKRLDASDLEALKAYASQLPPYSDFNFSSLWAWDTSCNRATADLDGNLVVRFTDYSTGDPFLSFLGVNSVAHTAEILLEYARRCGLPAELRLVPEQTVSQFERLSVRIGEDRDNFDYVYSVQQLAALGGRSFMAKRGHVHRFQRTHADARTETLALRDPRATNIVISVWDAWQREKSDAAASRQEHVAIGRLLALEKSAHIRVTGLFSNGMPVAFSIDEILPDGYSLCHFTKAVPSYAGAGDFLMHQKAKLLASMGVSYLNFEQDLGQPGLREAKERWRPIRFLKKYTVRFRE